MKTLQSWIIATKVGCYKLQRFHLTAAFFENGATFPTESRNPSTSKIKLIFEVPDSHLFLGVLRAWMTFKKPEMDKTLRNGLSGSTYIHCLKTRHSMNSVLGQNLFLIYSVPPLNSVLPFNSFPNWRCHQILKKIVPTLYGNFFRVLQSSLCTFQCFF